MRQANFIPTTNFRYRGYDIEYKNGEGRYFAYWRNRYITSEKSKDDIKSAIDKLEDKK